MQGILFQVDQTFCFIFITGSVIKCAVVALGMESVKEQRICVRFCFKVGKTAAKTHIMLHEAYGDDALSRMMTYEWF
jgi:hypothetical protein